MLLMFQVKQHHLLTEWRCVRVHGLWQTECFQQFECLCVSQVGFRKGGVDLLGRRTRLEVLLLLLLLLTLLALLACLLLLGLGFHSGTSRRSLLRPE